MAGDRIQAMSVELSKRLADEVSVHSADGKMFTSAQRLKALNSAREKLYNTYISKMGVDGFAEMFPEFLKEGDEQDVSSSKGTLYAGMRKLISVKLRRTINNSEQVFNVRRLPMQVYYELIHDFDSSQFQTSATDYGYVELTTDDGGEYQDPDAVSDIYLGSGYIYLVGDAVTSGSWRMKATLSGDMKIEYYTGGQWVEKGSFS